MEANEVVIVPFVDSFIPGNILSIIGSSQHAQVLRPWLPEIFECYDIYIWLDADL